MSNHTMKGTLFGGFKRSDVTEYIERLSKENMEALTLLREEVENLRRERDELSTEKDSLVQTNALLEAAKEEILQGKEVFSGVIYDNLGNRKCEEDEIIRDEILLEQFDWFVEGVNFYTKGGQASKKYAFLVFSPPPHAVKC